MVYDTRVSPGLIAHVRRWRYIELATQTGTLVVVVTLAAFLYRGTLDALFEALLVGLLAALLVGWYYAARTQTVRLRQLHHHATLVEHQEFTALYEHSPAPYLTIDLSGRIHRANGAAVRLFGETRVGISEQNFFSYIVDSPETGDVAAAVLAGKVRAGVVIAKEILPIKTASGGECWVEVSIFNSNDPEQRLVSLTDITDQRAVDTAKSEFVALATHQLRTPIAAIRWNVELLLRTMKESKTEKQDRYLTKIERNVLRMLHLINDFLSVSKLEMGTFAAEPETVDFSAYLAEILDEFEEKITTKQLTVQHTLTPAQFNVAIDRRLFHIISSNLLSNAVKYTPSGGTVTVSATATGGGLQFVVADSGIGIPEAEQADLFKKFFRASNAQQQVTEGTGLGLYVVKQSVEILGGTLELTSGENVGTTFTVTLPGVVR